MADSGIGLLLVAGAAGAAFYFYNQSKKNQAPPPAPSNGRGSSGGGGGVGVNIPSDLLGTMQNAFVQYGSPYNDQSQWVAAMDNVIPLGGQVWSCMYTTWHGYSWRLSGPTVTWPSNDELHSMLSQCLPGGG